MNLKILFLPLLFLADHLLCQDNTGRLDSLLKTYYKNEEPGMVIAVEVNGNIIFKNAYGLANLQTKDKINSITNFNIGSITKQFTAYCILRLAEQGHLSLSDKLIKFFPDFNPETGNKITIREMLTHSSGIVDHYAFTDTSIVRHATDKDVLEAVKKIDSTYFVPGSHYRYSNTAYCLLALIVEKLSGMTYAEYVRKNIFLPLSMDHSRVLKIGDKIDRQAIGYDIEETNNLSKKRFKTLDAGESIFFSTEGDGGIYTSMDDYLKWFHGLQSGTVLERSLIREARSPQFVIDTLNQLSYGYGWFIKGNGTANSVYHSGSNGGFRAIVFSIPAQKYAVIIFSNRTEVDLENLVEEINNLLHIDHKSFIKIESLVSFIDS
jgi:CubicO group peptidase (beta-lactamase class C family)